MIDGLTVSGALLLWGTVFAVFGLDLFLVIVIGLFIILGVIGVIRS